MSDYLTHLKENPLYFSVLFFAVLSGVLFLIFSLKKDRAKKTLIYSFSLALSIVVSITASMTVSSVFSTQNSPYRSFFSLFYLLIAFPLILKITKKALNLDFEEKDFLPPLILTASLQRVACMIEGCCGGVIPFQYVEFLLLLITFLYSVIWKDLSFPLFLGCYSFYRFAVEFFKDSYAFERIGALTVSQYLAIITVFTTAIILIKKYIDARGGQKNEK